MNERMKLNLVDVFKSIIPPSIKYIFIPTMEETLLEKDKQKGLYTIEEMYKIINNKKNIINRIWMVNNEITVETDNGLFVIHHMWNNEIDAKEDFIQICKDGVIGFAPEKYLHFLKQLNDKEIDEYIRLRNVELIDREIVYLNEKLEEYQEELVELHKQRNLL